MKSFLAALGVALGSTIILSFSLLPEAPTRANLNPYQGIQLCFGGANFQFIAPRDSSSPLAPRLDGLGNWQFEVSTKSEDAQYFMDQGLRLIYAFNHAEAHRSFQEAARLDPTLAMAYWGQALALGPNINDPFPDDNRQETAFEAIEKASDLMQGATTMEKELIVALSKRCTDQEGAEQQPLNVAYLEAMEKVYANHSDHPDIGTLYAAAIMNTMPWNYYDENWDPKPNTDQCVAALEKVSADYPEHPGAHHYYIHIIEAKAPTKAISNADALAEMMPAAGHMVHMPSHIYLAVGYYEKAAEQNRKAIEVDQDYIAQCQAQGVYPLAYYPHNIHFLWAAASMMGASREAIDAAEKVAMKVPNYLGTEIPFIQDFMAVPFQAFTRFGQWNEILTTPEPPNQLLHTRMIWHYARGMAFTRRGELEKAKIELEATRKLGAMEEVIGLNAAYNNPTSEVAKVAVASLEGEIEAAQGNWEQAIQILTDAVKFEEALIYQEPEAWHAPTRHYLGAVLLDAGKPEEAEAVYLADLQKHPNNGWALFGLQQALAAQGKAKEAQQVKMEFEKAWVNADIELTASRF